ncbi:unnamed protein product, partial [Choristocarpus tenellus]
SQARVAELEKEGEAVRLSAADAENRCQESKSKLSQLVGKYKEMRDTTSKSLSDAEAAAAAAKAEAAAVVKVLRQERDSAREELDTAGAVMEANEGRIVKLSEEVNSLCRERDCLLEGQTGLRLGAGVRKLEAKRFRALAGRLAVRLCVVRWRLGCVEAAREVDLATAESLAGKAETYEGVVKKLNDELEGQKQAIAESHYALQEQEGLLSTANDLVAQLKEEVLAKEIPTLAGASAPPPKVLLRVRAEAVGEGAKVEEDGEVGHSSQVWCLVQYHWSSQQSCGVGSNNAEEFKKEKGEELEEKDDSQVGGVEEEGDAESSAPPTKVIVEWRAQEEVDEWVTGELARVMAARGSEEGGLVALQKGSPPNLEMPPTLQEVAEGEVGRVRGELEAILEESRAELTRNTEAFNTYRARAHTALKNTAASQREAEASIAKAEGELTAERERVRKIQDEHTASEDRWAAKVAKLEQQLEESRQRTEQSKVQASELERNLEQAIEEGISGARAEVAAAKAQLESDRAAVTQLNQDLSTAQGELEKARREVKQKGQLARSLLAEKDAEIKRLLGGTEHQVEGLSRGLSPVVVGSPHEGVNGGRVARDVGATESRSLPVNPAGVNKVELETGGGGSGSNVVSSAASRHTEQQLLQMARMQAQRDEETGRLRHTIQGLAERFQEKEAELTAQAAREAELQLRLDGLERDRERGAQLSGEHSEEKMKYLKNVVKKFVTSEGNDRARLVPVVATILCFSPEEKREVDLAIMRGGGGASGWGGGF